MQIYYFTLFSGMENLTFFPLASSQHHGLVNIFYVSLDILLLPYFHNRKYEGGERAKNKYKIGKRKKNAECQSGLTRFAQE